MKFIVTVSTGNISQPLTRLLLQKGHEVVVISSNAAKKQEIENSGAAAAIGLVEDVDFLTTVFADADAAYAMIPPDFSVPDVIGRYKVIGTRYAQAIQGSGIKQVVLLSSLGAHLPEGTGVIAGSYQGEQLFNRLENVALTYLRPTSFYYNLLHHIDMIRTVGFIGTNFGANDKVAMVSPTDVAFAAAEELENVHIGKKIRYDSSDERTCNEVAGILGAAIGKPDLQWKLFSDEQTKAPMEKNGVAPHVAGLLVELNAAIHSRLIRSDYDLHQPEMGKVKIESFAKEFAAVFQQKQIH